MSDKPNMMHPNHPLRIFAISGILTIIIGAIFGIISGLDALWLFIVLAVMEVTFSFDNAVVNSRILIRLSPLWQKLFLTVGIFIAVFVVRFALPILIVMAATSLDFASVVNLSLNEPAKYSEALHKAAPVIDAFGGTFLLMIGINYFLDRDKVIHWLHPLERRLVLLGKVKFIKPIIMILVASCIYLTVDQKLQQIVLISSLVGIILHIGLESMGHYFEQSMTRKKSSMTATHLVGWAAFASFMYLEVLDASFSFDGVIGAFAITDNIVLIVAGLGVGALWVRSMTVYLMRSGTLAKYRYLEHGAHWAIFALGTVMLIKLYHIELPEWVTGSLGLVFIVTAVISSIIEKRRQTKTS
ncbi:MAG: DUF475 domain-containing protein [Candidatus Saccharimonadales bacterium]